MLSLLPIALLALQEPAPSPHSLTLLRGAEDLARGAELVQAVPVARGLRIDSARGRFTSRALESPAPFDQLLPSWNVTTPADASFVIEVSVGGADGAWSPWLHIGDWGAAPPADERAVAFDGGAVAIDVFESERHWTRCRVRLSGTGGSQPLVLERLAVCFTDTRIMRASSRTPAPPAGPPFTLDVPVRSQRLTEPALRSRVCSPTAVAMVLAHRDLERPTAEVARTLHDPAHDIYGNWNRAVQGAFTLGVPGHLARFGDWRAVEDTLRAGTPLVVSVRARRGELPGAPYRQTSGHLIVLVGFDAAGDVVCNDPAAPELDSVQRTYPRAALETVWMRNNGVAYVFDGARGD